MTDADYPHRHRPTHHAPVERFNELVIVQVNVCTKDRQPLLACEAGHRLCRDAWRAADCWRVGRYTIMPDHIHLFCAPGRVPTPSLQQWVEFWKSRIAARWPIQTFHVADTEVVPPVLNTTRIRGNLKSKTTGAAGVGSHAGSPGEGSGGAAFRVGGAGVFTRLKTRTLNAQVLGRQECLPHLVEHLLVCYARTGALVAVQTLGLVAPAQGGADIPACPEVLKEERRCVQHGQAQLRAEPALVKE